MASVQTLPHDGDKQSKRLRLAVRLLMILVIGCALGAVATIPRIFNTDNTSTAVKNNGDISGCRALFNSEVTAANASATIFNLQGQYAIVMDDDAALKDLTTPDPRTGLTRYEQVILDVNNAVGTSKRMVKLSASDPDKFLQECANLKNRD